jgi:hypothetical protein
MFLRPSSPSRPNPSATKAKSWSKPFMLLP